ncbi:DNA repair protein [Glutamicibacter halophytocola]|uniref:alpha-ketoglutarate-dependent dioxygenase AlkB family protein n=1 Tax=Glutamicibacter halophytocola TaxID=1933880 RepID=UPI0006D4A260|nr:alpha-ketoglutarate-dependent dioxygenase AlkB [Glutamicibacter halophytocola]ALG29987.1 DNA repair protein [Glutamicibacter halophytocola]
MESLFDDSALARAGGIVRPGVWHLPGWLSPAAQDWIVARFFQWGHGPVPPHRTHINGHPMSVQSLSLGWHWSPNRYSKTADDLGGAPVAPMEQWLVRLGQNAVAEATGDAQRAAAYLPDAAIVNFYDHQATMGMHQDADERINAPVVSLSIGDSATFRLGNTENRNRPWQDLRLASGDLLIFDGPARFAYHGVTRIHPSTAPAGCHLGAGRINITLRQTGLQAI